MLPPDLVLANARVRTVDGRNTVASAVAVKDGRFVAVGDHSEVSVLEGPAPASRTSAARR